MRRRGQLQHVFAFIMLILIAGVVLLLGYRFISRLLGDQCQVEQIQFADTLKQSVKDYAAYGTRKMMSALVPCDADAVCFVDASRYDPNNDGVYEGTSDPALFSSPNAAIEDEVRHPSTPMPANIFLLLASGVTQPLPFFADKAALADPTRPLCINATAGRFRIAFSGQGRTTIIREGT